MICAVGLATGCAENRVTDTNGSATLVFRGTVTEIVNAPVQRSNHDWMISMRVDQVEKGEFSGKTLNFRVHSPVKSGLTSNGTYRVEARLTQDGYFVDEFQWNR